MAIDRMSGADGGVETTFLGTPSLGCPQSHEKRYIHPDFGAELAGIVWDKVPKSSIRGVVSKRHSCAKCGTPLDPAAFESGLIAIPLHLREGGPFRLEIRSRLRRCPSCRHEQFPPELESELYEAMAKAFEAARFG